MTLLAWIALGLIAGLIAHTLVTRQVAVPLLDCILLGSLGAILGGALFGMLGSNIPFGLVGAAAGAITVLGVCAFVGRHGPAPTTAGRE